MVEVSMVSIFDLVLETRQQIYQLLIVHPEPLDHWEAWPKASGPWNTYCSYLALSRSCHQIHDEVRYTFYSENVFSFEFQEWPDKESVTAPELRFLQFWSDPSAGGVHLVIPQLAKCVVSITAPTCLGEDLKKHVYGQMLCKWLSRARQIKTLHVCLTNPALLGHWRPPIDKISKARAILENITQLKGLGLLGPFGQLRNVENFIIEGDVPVEYQTNLRSKMQGLEPTWPLSDMLHALKLYVFSYADSTTASQIKVNLELVNRALRPAANGDMGEFKRLRRKIKKLGDLRGLDSAILYANDPKQTTTNAFG